MTRLMRLPGKAKPQQHMTRDEALAAIRQAEREAEFQAAITNAADLFGWEWWHDVDSRKNRRGFPDLVLLKPGKIGVQGQLVFAELKAEDGVVSPEQQRWHDGLATVPGITARIWRPSNWAEVESVLRGYSR